MGVLGWIGAGAAGLAAVWLVQTVHLAVVLRWEQERTRGLAYYGLPPDGRAAFRRRLRLHARLLRPVLALTARLSKFSFARASFRHAGLAGPRGSTSPESFAAAMAFLPGPADVVVATQMKCGTTWMQHVVYEVLQRGRGDIVGSGATMYAVSPWLEGLRSVPVADAPLVGADRPSRIIKTHLPASHCPRGAEARFVYVARHPVSCFASCADFIATSAGRMAPSLDAVEEWFRSPEAMWWGTWPDHVAGWWDRAQQDGNVLFVHFEEMKGDLAGVAARVAGFLGVPPLDADEMAAVVEKCGFAYMQRHQHAFEMNPPHLLQTDAELFVRGSADRHRDVPPDVRARIAAWCAGALAGRAFPLGTAYPDVLHSAR
jgi:hypothetical protein